MLVTAAHNRLSRQQVEAEDRLNARLDALEGGVNRLLAMAGLPLIERPVDGPGPAEGELTRTTEGDHDG